MQALGRPECTSIQHGLFLAPQAITHPGWNPNTMNNDLTLLKLATPARYTAQISPVCLAAPNDVLPAGLTCVTTGWGRTSGVGKNLGRAFRQSGLVLASHLTLPLLLAHRQCDPRTSAAGGCAPGHCEPVPPVLGLQDHRCHDLCRWCWCLFLPGEQQPRSWP